MAKPILILSQSYPHVKNVLYLLDLHRDSTRAITLIVFNNKYLHEFFKELNYEHFGGRIKQLFVSRYAPAKYAKLKRYITIFERYHIYKSYRLNCASMIHHDVYFFSHAFTDYGYYYLRKLHKKNRITHIQDPGTDIYNITDGKPKGIRSIFNLVHMKMLFGRHLVIGDTGRKDFQKFLKPS